MRSEKRRVVTAVITATLALAVLLGIRPFSPERILAGYVLVIAAIVLASLTRSLTAHARERPTSQFEYLLERKPERPARPPELIRIERELTLGVATAAHLHNRLLPLLRDVAAARLGYELGQRPDAAALRLGDKAWQALRPDAPAPVDPAAPGLPLAQIRDVVTALERS
ncbi:MAG: hypothetical protein QOF43_1674 [Gaiellaceae bacterium]|nr:hypothetical protein [Gaiellaceae bacterium]